MVDPADLDSELRALDASDWPAYLESRSGLPGPRANLTLVGTVARTADDAVVDALLADGREFVTMCAAAAVARRADRPDAEARARSLAADDRWRVREGVVIGMQLLGDESTAAVIDIVERWADDPDLLVVRAAVAAICEPRLLRDEHARSCAVEVCRRCTARLLAVPVAGRKDPSVRTLRQALGYCWSVAVAAAPETGLAAFRSLPRDDADVDWIVRENRKKKRLRAVLGGEDGAGSA